MQKDNSIYWQLNAYVDLKASNELRSLGDKELIEQKGNGGSTYNIARGILNTEPDQLNTEPQSLTQELPSVIREQIEKLGDTIYRNKVKDERIKPCYRSFQRNAAIQISNITMT